MESNYSGRLSHVSSQFEMIPSSRALLSRDRRLPLDTWNQSGLQETFFEKSILYVEFNAEITLKELSLTTCKEIEKQAVPEAERAKTSHTSEDRQKSRHNSCADIRNKTVDYELYSRTAKTANIGIAIRQIP